MGTTAVRTGPEGSGAKGISLLVIPFKGNPGVTTRRIKVGGQVSAGTTFIEFDDVKVPVENLVGKEGEGMKLVMQNFNHERLYIAVGATRQARVALSAAFSYCLKREAFKKVRGPIPRCALRAISLTSYVPGVAPDGATRRPTPPSQMWCHP
jgi:acyl-CoA dehydrogenase